MEDVEVLYQEPQRPFVVIALVSYSGFTRFETIQSVIRNCRELAAEAGADAVIITSTLDQTFNTAASASGKAIKWTTVPPETKEEAKSSDVAVTGRATESKRNEVASPERAPVKPQGVPVFAHTAPGSQVLTVLQPRTVVTIELFTTGPEGDWCYIMEVGGKRRSGYMRCENLEWDRSPGAGPVTATVRLKE